MVEQLKRELSEAHRREAATADVLDVISRSKFELQPVFDAIVESGLKLFSGAAITIALPDGDMVKAVAVAEPDRDRAAALWRRFPIPLTREYMNGVAILDCRPVDIPDVEKAPPELAAGARNVRNGGNRAIAVMPMMRGDVAIGALSVVRAAPGALSEKQLAILKTFADQAVIAIENARLFTELKESLEYQTATSEVLSIIARSPAQVQPVLDAIVQNAGRLCHAEYAFVYKLENGKFHLVASNNAEAEHAKYIARHPPNLDRGSVAGRAALDCATAHIADALADPQYTRSNSQRLGKYRSLLGVPLLHDGEPIGVLVLLRTKVLPFTEKQIELVTAFANQAVIATQNVGLFHEVQSRTRELTQSLEYQTATGEVLNIISRSPVELQPVFDTIVETAARLCLADLAYIFKLDAGKFRLAAASNADAQHIKYLVHNPPPLERRSLAGRVALDRMKIHVADVLTDPEFRHWESQKRSSYRSLLGVPLLREGKSVGVIMLVRRAVLPFTDKQIELVSTFADQAVIAIANADLFEEVRARNRDLTALSEVARAVNSSLDLKVVLKTAVERAVELSGTDAGSIFYYRPEVDRFELGETAGLVEEAVARYRDLDIASGQTGLGEAIGKREPLQIPDVMKRPSNALRDAALAADLHAALIVPLFGGKGALGALVLQRRRAGKFATSIVSLMQSLADQSAIALENARLFGEVETSTRELTELLQQRTTTADVLKIISRSAFDLQVVLNKLVESAARLCGADTAAIWRPNEDKLQFLASYEFSHEYRELIEHYPVPLGRGSIAGRAVSEGRPVQVSDVLTDPEYAVGAVAKVAGYRTVLGVPLTREGVSIGVITLQRRIVQPFTDKQIELLSTFADQAVIAIEITRLFEEVQARTRELAKTIEDLELASQHKSQFVANMSHELRTPLAAILGYAELMQDGFYEPLGQKSFDALGRIRSNGKHLLGLINTVLDIAKIESGQFTLNMAEYEIDNVVETVRSATESLAQNKKLALKTEVAKALPIGLGDEQRLTQVLLNLVGNAIKFTDSGEVRVTAIAINGHFSVSVIDTGPGIPADQRTRIFEQFHQVDSSNTKAKGGTGLGLAITKQIVEMHGGRIWVESTLGKGSTFQMELPTRAEVQKTGS
jgi:GAF domain-containing protein